MNGSGNGGDGERGPPTGAWESSDPGPDDPRVIAALEEYQAAWQAGQTPNRQALLARHPDIAAALADCLDGLDLVRQAGLPLRSSGGDPAAGGDAGIPPGTCLGDYCILREVGRGGMGVVYQAHDPRRQEAVALKVMRRSDARSLYRFKQEFRALADLSHPNLVALYDLVGEGGHWFFTMEFVEGADFLAHVRAGPGRPDAAEAEAVSTGNTSRDATGPEGVAAAGAPVAAPRLAHLRRALAQLARGVAFLHRAGKLHRDIKPTNVRVTRQGRVVLLDFGLAVELDPSGGHANPEQEVAGTAAYMAPEQGAGRPLTAASDWYSVGAMLYEALTGRLPFSGSAARVLRHKQAAEPPPPRDLVPEVPEDLDALCADLVRRDPAARPSGEEVLRRLAAAPAADEGLLPCAGAGPLVGRAPHLAALADAFAAVRRGQAVAVYVHGRSGMGKTALVKHFLDDLDGRGEAVVLAGRCCEREAVPYKALDGLVDALSRHLQRLGPEAAEAMLPPDTGALAQVFPVLRQVPAVTGLPRGGVAPPDRRELRRRAFAALRQLLERLGAMRPLVLAIDDLQWGDLDSAALLAELLRPPEPPALLLVACYRSEDAATSPCLRALLGAEGPAAGGAERRELAVGPLAVAEARSLVLALLGGSGPAAEGKAEAIARESEGHPLFAQELAQEARAGGGAAEPAAGPTLEEVLWRRVGRLPEGARRLLEVVAVGGAPLRREEAVPAAGLGGGDRAALVVLRAARLVRGTGPAEEERVETYHDRVRETVLARLPPSVLAGHHRSLAVLLEASGQADPEALGRHWQGANEGEKAGRHYARAAGQAAEVLAFDRAARFYRLALELGRWEDAERRRLRAGLGDALANAGRGAEAAREYLAAAEGATAGALDLRRRASFQLLISGHVDEGLRVLGEVLQAVGLRLAATPRRALWSLRLRRVQLWLRGLRYRERDVSQVPPDELRRIDVCWSVSIGLGMVDPIRAADFQTRHLLAALRAGEPSRIALALATEGAFRSLEGRKAMPRATRYMEAAERLARRLGQPYPLGYVTLMKAAVAFHDLRWKSCYALCEEAGRIFREQCAGVGWEADSPPLFYHDRRRRSASPTNYLWDVDSTHIFSLYSLALMGEVAELSRRLPALLRDAQERQDFLALATLSTWFLAVQRVAADDTDGVRGEIDQAMSRWPPRGYHVQHHLAVVGRATVDLYDGAGEAAWEYLAREWKAFAGSLLVRLQSVRIHMLQMRAAGALAAARTAARPEAFLREAERHARRLERERVAWGEALAPFIRAAVAAARGDAAGARPLLARAAEAFEAIGHRLHAAAARRRLGELTGGAAGRDLVEGADAWMRGQEIRNPARMTALLAPGFPT